MSGLRYRGRVRRLCSHGGVIVVADEGIPVELFIPDREIAADRPLAKNDLVEFSVAGGKPKRLALAEIA